MESSSVSLLRLKHRWTVRLLLLLLLFLLLFHLSCSSAASRRFTMDVGTNGAARLRITVHLTLLLSSWWCCGTSGEGERRRRAPRGHSGRSAAQRRDRLENSCGPSSGHFILLFLDSLIFCPVFLYFVVIIRIYLNGFCGTFARRVYASKVEEMPLKKTNNETKENNNKKNKNKPKTDSLG